jgi:hypothetical protein
MQATQPLNPFGTDFKTGFAQELVGEKPAARSAI